jgi:hypothetical protein
MTSAIDSNVSSHQVRVAERSRERRRCRGLSGLAFGILVSTVLGASVGCRQYEPDGEIVDVGPAHVPSRALRKQVREDQERVLFLDTSYGVRRAVIRLHECWGSVERRRHEVLSELLDSMRDALDAAGEDTRSLRGVTMVARGLLDYLDEGEVLDAAERDELAEVQSGRSGRMRFLGEPVAHDWASAHPTGGYGAEGSFDGEDDLFAGLFRVTIYLRSYLDAWPGPARSRFIELAHRLADESEDSRFAEVERSWQILFGVDSIFPGLPGTIPAPDHGWLARRRDAPGEVDDVLPGMFEALPFDDPSSFADGMLHICHELSTARPADPVFSALPHRAWQQKWNDAAAFAYVGLREVDVASRISGLEPLPDDLRIVIEPLPEVWRAIRFVDLLDDELAALRFPGSNYADGKSWVDPVLTALAIQQAGNELPPDLRDDLISLLLEAFDEPDLLLGTISEIEGLRSPVRRAVPRLVRLPIVWQGEVVQVLALRLFVEEVGEGGGGGSGPD